MGQKSQLASENGTSSGFHSGEDEVRLYKSKGYGKAVAALITLAYLFLLPIFLQHFFKFMLTRFTPTQLYVIMGIGLHTGLYFFSHLIMYFIYTSKIPYFERYRIITAPWPWENNPEEWRVILKETLQTYLLVHIVIIPGLVLIDAHGEIAFRFDMDHLPTVFEILSQIIFVSIIEDTWFYWGHRLMHHPRIYPSLHKKHHKYTITVSIAAEHFHIIDYFFVGILSTAVGVKILGDRMHYITYILYVVFRVMESINAHCGYDFSWSPYGLLPLCQPSSWHNFHHSNNAGNFSGGFWDYICGTHKPYLEYKKKLEKAKTAEREAKKAQ